MEEIEGAHWVLLARPLIGYCQGYFGRDSYAEKIIEGVGDDWIVARDDVCGIVIATFKNGEELRRCYRNWTSKEYIKEWKDR